MKKSQVFVGLLVALVFFPMTLSTQRSDAQSYVKLRRTERPIPERYIVVLKDKTQRQDISKIALNLMAGKGSLLRVFQYALKGFSVRLPKSVAYVISQDARVDYVVEDGEVNALRTQNNPPWGLDRIDQEKLPLSQTYTYSNTGAEVNAYVIDTGILTTHPDFGGRAYAAFNTIADGQGSTDCNGHGTHVAGIIGSNTYGVAKGVRLNSVRVLGCNGSGSLSDVIAGIDWITRNAIKPAVANLSLGGGANDALDTAVRNSINSGITYTIAAGNSAQDASLSSPARVSEAITVGAQDISDNRAYFSNFGFVVDLFAPGLNIVSTYLNNSTASFSGTSEASPFVAGTVALYLQANPYDTPANVSQVIVNRATVGFVNNPGPGSPNRQLSTNIPELLNACSNPNFVTRIVNNEEISAFALYRYYQGTLGDHFYTTNYCELGVGRYGYILEGIQSYIPIQQNQGTLPLYRYFNGSDHFYTTNFAELGAGKYGYYSEGFVGFIYPTQVIGTVPLYRYFNGNDHFYTTNFTELGAGRYGYGSEGIAGYVIP